MSPDDPSDPESVEQLRQELEAEKQRIAALEAENAALLAATGGTGSGDWRGGEAAVGGRTGSGSRSCSSSRRC